MGSNPTILTNNGTCAGYAGLTCNQTAWRVRFSHAPPSYALVAKLDKAPGYEPGDLWVRVLPRVPVRGVRAVVAMLKGYVNFGAAPIK